MVVRRYHWLGWVLAGLIFLFHLYYVTLDKVQPVPVIAVNEAGAVLGTFEYLNPMARSETELEAAAISFLRAYLSADSATIFEDAARALNMMDETLAAAIRSQWIESGYLSTISSSPARSHFRSFNAEVLDRREQHAQVRVTGERVLTIPPMGDKRAEDIVTEFDITLPMAIIPRTRLATHGVRILDIVNN
ncbi:hypothetical protein CAI21_22375 [Alkalilimnicola ehrlichii]|nr:hypothetical protein CAI21_22375 [Alkalilimnicola ehrlichii]